MQSKKNIIGIFLDWVAEKPDGTALICGDRKFSYSEISSQTAHFCDVLLEHGVEEGTRILVLLHNSAEFAILLLAAAELGATIVPISPSLKPHAVLTALDASDCGIVIGDHVTLSALIRGSQAPLPAGCIAIGGDAPGCRRMDLPDHPPSPRRQLGTHAVDPSKDYILTMTSGSTGTPKPIVFTQQTKIDRALDGARDLYCLASDEVVIAASPMYHSLAQRMVLLPLMIGGTSVILPRFTPRKWLAAVEAYRVTFTIAVSTQLELILAELVKAPADVSSLKCIVSSSALMKPETKTACIAAFRCEFHECYGASEVGIVTNLFPRDAATHLKSVGKGLDYVDIKIMGPGKTELPIGEAGEIACSTKTLFSRYYKQEQATRESVIDGYFYTGDVGYLDAEGFLFFSSRKKDIIIVGGMNVYPPDVESVIAKFDGIAECAVIGVEDQYFGEAVVAILVLDREIDLLQLRRRVSAELADFQQPIAYEIVESLPRNEMGKVMKQHLREQFSHLDPSAMIRKLMRD